MFPDMLDTEGILVKDATQSLLSYAAHAATETDDGFRLGAAGLDCILDQLQGLGIGGEIRALLNSQIGQHQVVTAGEAVFFHDAPGAAGWAAVNGYSNPGLPDLGNDIFKPGCNTGKAGESAEPLTGQLDGCRIGQLPQIAGTCAGQQNDVIWG